MVTFNTKDIGWSIRESHLGAKTIYLYYTGTVEIDISVSSLRESSLKDWSPTLFMWHEELLPAEDVKNREKFELTDQGINGWMSRIRDELYSISMVENIFVTIEDNDINVWVVIPRRDITVLRQIVEKEDELLKVLVSGDNPALFIDFHVIYRCDRDMEKLAPTRAISLPKEVM